MRAVYTYWRLPTKGLIHNFYDIEMFYWSWAMSVFYAKLWFDEVVLYCDSRAKEMLVDDAGLEFDEIHLLDDKLATADTGWWTYAKILALSEQKSPFIHIDGDLFLWQTPSEEYLKSTVGAFMVEPLATWPWTRKIYTKALHAVQKGFWLPEYFDNTQPLKATGPNTGLFMFNDMALCEEYTQSVLEFFQTNRDEMHKRHPDIFLGVWGFFTEQYFLKCLMDVKNIPIVYYSPHANHEIATHLLGSAKADKKTAGLIKQRGKFHCWPLKSKIADAVRKYEDESCFQSMVEPAQ